MLWAPVWLEGASRSGLYWGGGSEAGGDLEGGGEWEGGRGGGGEVGRGGGAEVGRMVGERRGDCIWGGEGGGILTEDVGEGVESWEGGVGEGVGGSRSMWMEREDVIVAVFWLLG